MTSDLSTVEIAMLARIKTILEAVANVGNVYKRERWAVIIKDHRLVSVATIDGQPTLRFWTASLDKVSDPIQIPTQQPGQNRRGRKRTFEFKVVGIFGHNDDTDTETAAKVVILDVINNLDTDATLNSTYWNIPGCELRMFELMQFGSDLVHYAEIICKIESAM